MQSSRGKTLDERMRTEPLLQAEFILYVYYQYNENLTDSDVIESLGKIAEGKDADWKEGSLESAITTSLYGKGISGNTFQKEDALKAIERLKVNVETSVKEGHDFLNELVIRDYALFEPYLVNAYHDFMEKTSSLASIHNYLDAEMEIYRAACFCFPGARKHADELFTRIFSKEKEEVGDENVRKVEFLQWFVGQYVIPAVDTVPSEWYYSRFSRYLNQRVTPIMRDVVQQRRSVFVVSGRSKNSVMLDDLLYAESFSVKMTDASQLSKGNVVECTLVRYAASRRINSVVKLLSSEEAEKVVTDVNSRRELMADMHNDFVSEFGSEALLLANPQEAVARFNEFAAHFTERKGLKDASLPRLINAEAFNSYPDFRTALLCELNNFYLSIYYPLFMDAIEGRMNSDSASEITDICLTNAIALPFSTLRRVLSAHGARVLEMEASLHPELASVQSMIDFILRERGHTWEYLPLPLVAGSEPLGSVRGTQRG